MRSQAPSFVREAATAAALARSYACADTDAGVSVSVWLSE